MPDAVEAGGVGHAGQGQAAQVGGDFFEGGGLVVGAGGPAGGDGCEAVKSGLQLVGGGFVAARRRVHFVMLAQGGAAVLQLRLFRR